MLIARLVQEIENIFLMKGDGAGTAAGSYEPGAGPETASEALC